MNIVYMFIEMYDEKKQKISEYKKIPQFLTETLNNLKCNVFPVEYFNDFFV